MSSENRKSQSGFSMIELMVVVLVILVVAGYAVPNILSFIHMTKLRGSASDYASILQVGRIRSVQDNKFYSIYLVAGSPQEAYVDLTNNGGTVAAPGDPLIALSGEVVPVAAGGAPDATDLQNKFLPAGAPAPNDGSAVPVIFSSHGLPCTTQAATGGNVCTGALATAFWVFFQDTVTSSWEAVTVSPAGRIQKWQHGSSDWTKL